MSILIGSTLGIICYTFYYGHGTSYLSNDPKACMNCHIMKDHFLKWEKSSHRNVAVCNDCHMPKGLLSKLFTKASNGFWHSYYFTFDNFHDPIFIKKENQIVAENNCRKCHENIIHAIDTKGIKNKQSCLNCHLGVGHPSF